MIPDHIIAKAKTAYINRCGKTCSHESLTAALEAVAADIWEQGCEAFEVAHKQDRIEPWEHLRDNPYRASETT